MKILLVDDKAENLYLLEKILQGNGYETLSAANGAEALEAALKNPPDMIVSDILMPVMDGFTLCREWRKNKLLKKIPFVFYTATYTGAKDEEFALSIGADRFIVKPQEVQVFLNIIKETFDSCKVYVSHPKPTSHPVEKVFLKEYNEALVRKLEDKMVQLEAVEKELREKNTALELDIKERMRSENALALINHTFKSIVDCVSITDCDNNILFVNQTFLDTYGYAESELIGKSILIVRADVHSGGDTVLQETLSGGWKGEILNRKKDGTVFPVSLSTSVVYDEKKQPIALVGIASDNTERKHAEEQLLQTQMLLRSSLESPKDMIIMCIDRNYRYLYFNKAHKDVMKFAYNKDVEVGMNVLDCITSEEDRQNAKSNYDRALSGESHTNIKEYGDVNRSYYESFFNPIYNEKNEIVGMTAFAKDITERKRIEQELQNSEKRLASIFDTVGDSIFLIDVEKDGEYRFASVNQTFLKTTGLPLEAIVGKRVRDVIPEPSLTLVLGKYSQAIQERTIIRWEETTNYPTGKLTGEVSIAPMFDVDGNCIHLIGTVHDITDRKRAEEALKLMTNRNEAILASVPDIIMEVDNNKVYKWANRAGIEYFGDDVIGKEAAYYFEGEQKTYDTVQPIFSGDENIFYVESWQRRRDGEKRLLGWWCRVLKDAKGNVTGALSSAQDITERKQADEVLRQKTALLEAQLNSSIDGIIVVDSQGKKIIQNQRTIVLWKIPQHIADNPDDQMQVRHVMQMTKNPEQFVKKITDLYDHPNETSRDEIELTDGTVLDRYSAPVLGSDGKNYGRIWAFRDITERKRIEEVLEERDIQFRKLAAQVPGMIYQFKQKPDGTFCVPFTSDGIRDLFGCSPQDVHDDFSPIAKVIVPEDLNIVVSSIQDSARHLTPWHCVYRVQIPGQPIRWMDGRSMPEKQHDGSILWHGFNTDITEQKRAEEAVRQSEKNYRMLFDQMTSGFAVHEIIFDENNHPVDYRFLQANTAYEKLMGLRANDIIGKTILEVLPETDPSFIKRYGEVAFTGKDIQFETYTQEINKYFSIRAYAPEQGKFATVFEDITERKRTEEALAKEQYLMNTLMDNVPDHIYFKDNKSRFVRMNKAQATRFGLSDPAEAVGKTDFDFFTEQHAQPAFEDEQKIMNTGQPIIGLEEKETWPDGSVTWVTTTKMPLRDTNGDIIGTFGISKDITTRKRAEEELRKSEEKYRSIFENVRDVYYEALIDGTILEISPSIEIVSKGQYTRDSLIGKSMYDFYSDAGRRQTLLTLLQEQGAVDDFEMNLRNRDGSLVPCSISSKICFDAEGHPQKIIGSMRDITQRNKAEEALRETRDYLENLLSFANAPIIVWDPHFKITRFNMAIEKLTGYTMYDVTGKHLEMLFPAESRKSSLSLIAPTSEGNHLITAEIPILCKNGSIRNVLWNTANIYAANGQTLVSTIAQGQDITEQKKLQQELLQSQKMQSIGTLAGGIAHDFNNILGIILGYTSLIERETLSKEKIHESIGIIKNTVGRGASLVGQILTFARKTDVVFQPLNVTVLIHELLSMLKQTFPRVITFIENVDKNIPYINADKTQIHQILLNLCVNARDAMPNGGTITLKTEKRTKTKVQERIPAADQDSYICISVTDTGEGMSEAIRRQIFDPFFTTKEQGKGTGLGLAVVYGAVQSHHGFIDVESEVGRGTTFRLYFPIPSAGEISADISLPTESFTTGGTETILLVEDEETLIEMARFLLESNGYKVHTAKDGREAIKLYKQHQQEIDIVLTDMGLPGMTGIEVLRTLKELNPNVSAIVASGYFEPDVKSKLDKIGVKGFIQKPYSTDEVLRKLREVMDEKKK
jgi:PAS domain S-box-containing protein